MKNIKYFNSPKKFATLFVLSASIFCLCLVGAGIIGPNIMLNYEEPTALDMLYSADYIQEGIDAKDAINNVIEEQYTPAVIKDSQNQKSSEQGTQGEGDNTEGLQTSYSTCSTSSSNDSTTCETPASNTGNTENSDSQNNISNSQNENQQTSAENQADKNTNYAPSIYAEANTQIGSNYAIADNQDNTQLTLSLDDSNHGTLSHTSFDKVKSLTIATNGSLKVTTFDATATDVTFTPIDNFAITAWEIIDSQGKSLSRLVTDQTGAKTYSFESTTDAFALRAITSQAKAIYDETAETLTFKYDVEDTGANVFGIDEDAGYTGSTPENTLSYAPMYYYAGITPKLTSAIIDSSFASFKPKSTSAWFGWTSATSFNIDGLANINLEQTYNASCMFYGWQGSFTASGATTKDLSLNAPKLTNAFAIAANSKITSCSFSDNTKAIKYLMYAFSGDKSLTTVSFATDDSVSSVVDFTRMCENCDKLTNFASTVSLSSTAKSFAMMFQNCLSLDQWSHASFLQKNTTDKQAVYKMFFQCRTLGKTNGIDLSNWDTTNIGTGKIPTDPNITYTQDCFTGANEITSITIGTNWQVKDSLDKWGLYTPEKTAYGKHWFTHTDNKTFNAADIPGTSTLTTNTTFYDAPTMKTLTPETNNTKFGNPSVSAAFEMMTGQTIHVIATSTDNYLRIGDTDDAVYIFAATNATVEFGLNKYTFIKWQYWTDSETNYQDLTGDSVVFNDNMRIKGIFAERNAYAEIASTANGTTFTLKYDFDYSSDKESSTQYKIQGTNAEKATEASKIPWYGKRKDITSVIATSEFANYLSPQTAWWFEDFEYAVFDETSFANFDLSKSAKIESMYNSCKKLTAVDFAKYKKAPSTVCTNCKWLFNDCTTLTSITNLSKFNTQSVTTMNAMFKGCSALTSVDTSSFNTSSVVEMQMMFNDCSKLSTIGKTNNVVDVSNFDMSKVSTCWNMMKGLKAATGTIKGPGTDDKPTTFEKNCNCEGMFAEMNGGTANVTIDLYCCDFSNVSNCKDMYYNSSNIKVINMGRGTPGKETGICNLTQMFFYATNLTTIYTEVEEGGNGSSVQSDNPENSWYRCKGSGSDTKMFAYADKIVGGEGTIKASGQDNALYAKEDRKNGKSGYPSSCAEGYFTRAGKDERVSKSEALASKEHLKEEFGLTPGTNVKVKISNYWYPDRYVGNVDGTIKQLKLASNGPLWELCMDEEGYVSLQACKNDGQPYGVYSYANVQNGQAYASTPIQTYSIGLTDPSSAWVISNTGTGSDGRNSYKIATKHDVGLVFNSNGSEEVGADITLWYSYFLGPIQGFRNWQITKVSNEELAEYDAQTNSIQSQQEEENIVAPLVASQQSQQNEGDSSSLKLLSEDSTNDNSLEDLASSLANSDQENFDPANYHGTCKMMYRTSVHSCDFKDPAYRDYGEHYKGESFFWVKDFSMYGDLDFNKAEILYNSDDDIHTSPYNGIHCIDPDTMESGVYVDQYGRWIPYWQNAYYTVLSEETVPGYCGYRQFNLQIDPVGASKRIYNPATGLYDGFQRGQCKLRIKTTGGIEVYKDTDTSWSKSNENYCLYSTNEQQTYYDVFRINSDGSKGPYVCGIKLNQNGDKAYGKVENLPIGEYIVQESQNLHGKNYMWDSKTYKVKVETNKITTLNGSSGVKDTPAYDSAGISLAKADSATGQILPAAGMSFEGAQYRWRYYEDQFTKLWDAPDTAKNQWIMKVKTDTAGHATTSLCDGDTYKVSGDELYKDAAGNAVYPLGTYIVEEYKAPPGYYLSARTFIICVTAKYDTSRGTYGVLATIYDEDGKKIETATDPHYPQLGTYAKALETKRRVDYSFKKVDQNGNAMAKIPFAITNNTTKETHVVVTDADGFVSTASEYAKHSTNTNCNDFAYDERSTGIDESKLKQNTGVFWYKTSASTTTELSDNTGAFEEADYTVEELPVSGNSKTELKTWQFTTKNQSGTVSEGVVVDNEVAIIQTTAMTDEDTKSKTVEAKDAQPIIDNVEYKNLHATTGSKYKLVATLMDKSTGTQLVNSEGTTISAVEKEFVPTASEGTEKVEFRVDARLLQGKTIVVYEQLYDISFGKTATLVTSHESLVDANQTVQVKQPKLQTELLNADTEEKVVPKREVKFADILSYQGLSTDTEYTVETILIKASDESEVYKGTSKFTPTSADGKQSVEFTVDLASFTANEKLIAYETVSLANKNIVIHKDKGDAKQTVTVVERNTLTQLVNSDGEKYIPRNTSVVLTDHLSYAGLEVGRLYNVESVIKYNDNGTWKDLYTQNVAKPAKTANGSWEIKITLAGTITASLPVDSTLCVTEIIKSAATGGTVDTHDGTTDTAQQIKLRANAKSELLQCNDLSASKVIPQLKNLELVDTVSLDSLEAGKTYTATASIVNKENTSTVLTTKSVEFTASDVSAVIAIEPIVLDTSQLAACTQIVAFDQVKENDTGRVLTEHQNVDDYYQTLTVGSLQTQLLETSSGSKEIACAGNVSLTDSIMYNGLYTGVGYTLHSKLVKSDGTEFASKDINFTPTATSGSMSVVYENLDTSTLNYNDKLIAYERVSINGYDSPAVMHEDLTDANQTVTLVQPTLATKLVMTETGSQLVPKKPDLKAVDTLTYTNLNVGQEYIVYTTLMKSDGTEFKSYEPTKFIPTTANGSSSVMLEIDTTSLNEGDKLIAYEKITTLARGIEIDVVDHKDLTDENQSLTVQSATASTTLLNTQTGTHEIPRSTDVKLKDTVNFTGLFAGDCYSIKTQLVYQNDPSKVFHEQSQIFTAGASNGSINVDILVDTSSLQKDDVLVAFETISINDTEIVKHADVSDTNQQVKVGPEGCNTTLVETASGSHTVPRSINVALTDTVQYSGLKADTPYTIESRLVQKVNKEGVWSIETYGDTKTQTFTPQTATGSETVTFNIDSHSLDAGVRLVAYEVIKLGNKVVIAHENYDDDDQAVTIESSSIETDLVETATGTKYLPRSSSTSITDSVNYTGLVTGATYKLKGRLTYKDASGSEVLLSTAETPFIPNIKNSEGKASIEFTGVNTTGIPADTMIEAFEQVYQVNAAGQEILIVEEPRPQAEVEREMVTLKDIENITNCINYHSKNKTIYRSTNTRIDDEVSLNFLNIGEKYTLKSELIRKDNATVVQTLNYEFTPEVQKHYYTAMFAIDTTNDQAFPDTCVLAAKDTLYAADGTVLSVHNADLSDTNQQVTLEGAQIIKTQLLANNLSQTKVVPRSANLKLTDTITFKDFKAGVKYSIKGELVYEDATKEFPSNTVVLKEVDLSDVALNGSGTFDVVFEGVDTRDLPAGQKIVAIETITDESGNLIGEHKNIADTEQMVSVETMTTSLVNTEDGRQIVHNGDSLTDTVNYSCLEPGETYTVKSSLVYAASEPIHIETLLSLTNTFTPSTSSGTYEVAFKDLDLSELDAGTKLIATEEITDSTGTLIAVHNDLSDEKQTVVTTGKMNTVLTTADGAKEFVKSNSTKFVDTLIYSDLNEGETYETISQLVYMDANDNKVVLHSENNTFVAKEGTDQKQDIILDNGGAGVDTTSVPNDTKVVAFEQIKQTSTGTIVADHCDINDLDQTVIAYDTEDYNPSPTGDFNGVRLLLIAIAILSSSLLALGIKRKFRRK